VSLKAEELVLDLMGEDARAGSCTSRDFSTHELYIFSPASSDPQTVRPYRFTIDGSGSYLMRREKNVFFLLSS
jgi:hypothetical protein